MRGMYTLVSRENSRQLCNNVFSLSIGLGNHYLILSSNQTRRIGIMLVDCNAVKNSFNYIVLLSNIDSKFS